MSEMIERAAKAIQRKLHNMDEPHDRCALIATDAQAMQLARVAMEAIRIPRENGFVQDLNHTIFNRMINDELSPD